MNVILSSGMGTDLSETFRKDFSHSPNIALSSPSRSMPSPNGGQDFTPSFGSDTSSFLDQVEATCGCTSDLQEASTVTPRSDKLTPVIFFKGRPGVEDTFGPDAPELRDSDDGVCLLLLLIFSYSSFSVFDLKFGVEFCKFQNS